MSKRKFNIEMMGLILKHLTAGLKSSSEVAKEISVNVSTINEWLLVYEKYGIEYFRNKEVNATYTKEFRAMVVAEFLEGKISQRALCIKYNISSHSVLKNWIIWYNEGKEFMDYAPNKGIYQMKSRKTTKNEKFEIVQFCIANNCNYKLTAEKFVVPYSQVYQWVLKYKKNSVTGLEDKRGKRKPIAELSEVDKLKRELELTKRKLEYAQIENEVLKKKKKSS